MSIRAKLDRARQWERERLGLDEKEAKTDPNRENLSASDELEKGDRFAIHFSAFTTLFLPAALVVAAFGGLLLLLVSLF